MTQARDNLEDLMKQYFLETFVTFNFDHVFTKMLFFIPEISKLEGMKENYHHTKVLTDGIQRVGW
jgi:hypothetical protein